MARIPGTPTYCVLAVWALAVGLAASTPGVRRDPQRPGPLFPLEQAWTTPLPSPPVSGPVLDADRAYVSLSEGTLAAVDRETGELLWTADAGASLSPAIAGDLVLSGGAAGLAAWDTKTGEPRWVLPLPVRPAWITVEGGMVITGAGSDVLAFGARDGASRWSATLGGEARERPAVLGGRLAVADESGVVTLFDAINGAVLWRRQLGGRPGSPALSHDRVFLGTGGREFWALSAVSGATLWQWHTGGDVAGAAVDGTRVYVATLDNLIRAFDVASGNQQWKAVFATRPAGPPQVAQGMAVVSGISPRIEGFARRNGASAGSAAPVGELSGAPALSGEIGPFRVAVIAATRNGAITGYRPVRMLFKEPPSAPLTALPGRPLPHER